MLGLVKLPTAVLCWLTAAATLLAGLPRFECRCPDGSSMPFGISTASACRIDAAPPSSLPVRASCCGEREACAGNLRGGPSVRSNRQAAPELWGGGCVRTLARSQGEAAPPTRAVAQEDHASGVLLPTPVVPLSLANPNLGLHTTRTPDSSPAPSSGLVILLQRLLV